MQFIFEITISYNCNTLTTFTNTFIYVLRVCVCYINLEISALHYVTKHDYHNYVDRISK